MDKKEELLKKESQLDRLIDLAERLAPSAPSLGAENKYNDLIDQIVALNGEVEALRQELGINRAKGSSIEEEKRRAEAERRRIEEEKRQAELERQRIEEEKRRAEEGFLHLFNEGREEVTKRFGDLRDFRGIRVSVIRTYSSPEINHAVFIPEGAANDDSGMMETVVLMAEDGREIKQGEWLVSANSNRMWVSAGQDRLSPAGLNGIPETPATADWLPKGAAKPQSWNDEITGKYPSQYDCEEAWREAFEFRAKERAEERAKKESAQEEQPQTAMAAALMAALGK